MHTTDTFAVLARYGVCPQPFGRVLQILTFLSNLVHRSVSLSRFLLLYAGSFSSRFHHGSSTSRSLFRRTPSSAFFFALCGVRFSFCSARFLVHRSTPFVYLNDFNIFCLFRSFQFYYTIHFIFVKGFSKIF